MPLHAADYVMTEIDLPELGAYLAKRKADLVRTRAQMQLIEQDVAATESQINKAAVTPVK